MIIMYKNNVITMASTTNNNTNTNIIITDGDGDDDDHFNNLPFRIELETAK